MRLGPLDLFVRQNCNGEPSNSVLIAALHWQWSLTWRWIFSRGPWYRPPGRQGFSFMWTHRYAPGINFHACFNAPLLGHWSLQTQPNMPRIAAEGRADPSREDVKP